MSALVGSRKICTAFGDSGVPSVHSWFFPTAGHLVFLEEVYNVTCNFTGPSESIQLSCKLEDSLLGDRLDSLNFKFCAFLPLDLFVPLT